MTRPCFLEEGYQLLTHTYAAGKKAGCKFRNNFDIEKQP